MMSSWCWAVMEDRRYALERGWSPDKDNLRRGTLRRCCLGRLFAFSRSCRAGWGSLEGLLEYVQVEEEKGGKGGLRTWAIGG
jgi:hypothetical protein